MTGVSGRSPGNPMESAKVSGYAPLTRPVGIVAVSTGRALERDGRTMRTPVGGVLTPGAHSIITLYPWRSCSSPHKVAKRASRPQVKR